MRYLGVGKRLDKGVCITEHADTRQAGINHDQRRYDAND